MMKCAKCGGAIHPASRYHVGPYKALKCAKCGPWTQPEMAQVLKRFGAHPGAFAEGCACQGRR